MEEELRLVHSLLAALVDGVDDEIPGLATVRAAEDRSLDRDAVADLPPEAFRDLPAHESAAATAVVATIGRAARAFSVDADWLTTARNPGGVDFFVATIGSELYSDLLGGGRNRFFNPYLGIRVGYANLMSDGAFALGGVAGVEMFKTESLTLELDLRGPGRLGVGAED